MDKIVLKDIEVNFDLDAIAAAAHVRRNTNLYEKLEIALQIAQQTVKPKAVIKMCTVNTVKNDVTTINGVDFKSKTISGKLYTGGIVFLYVITAGTALGKSDDAVDDFIIYVLETAALAQGYQSVKKKLQENYGYKEMDFFEPGSLPDWPIENNKTIFEMIGTVAQDIGVSLKSSHFMIPNNTLSGILFAEKK